MTERVRFEVAGAGDILDVLDKENININVLDAIGFSGRFGSYVWVDPKDVKAAAKALKV